MPDAPQAVPTEASSDPFRGLVLAAAQRVIEHAFEALGEASEVAARFPFLGDYVDVTDEIEVAPHEPLAQLVRCCEWPVHAVELWLVCGLLEEDARFAEVFEAFDQHTHARHPSLALMQRWWGTLPRTGVRPALRALLEAGVLQACNPGAALSDQLYEVEENCWAAARGEAPRRPLNGVWLAEAEDARPSEQLLISPKVAEAIDEIASRLFGGQPNAPGTVLLRGPPHNGRSSLLAALARAEGRRTLHIEWPLPASEHAANSRTPAWLGAFATLTGARPILHVQATPGEALRLPALRGYQGWVGVVCGDADAFEQLQGPVWSLHVPLPHSALRCGLIERFGGSALQSEAASVGEQVQMSSGHLVRALLDAAAPPPTAEKMAAMLRDTALSSGSAALDSLAQRLDGGGDWDDLVLDPELQRDLQALEARCRQRECLRDTLPGPFAERLNVGVRALFVGPSGTGKTLAAKVLAARLCRPLYRLDLSSVVSKFIGETERNLQRLLSAAEALDIMLLLDEGDALLAKRTDVSSANDRYANLETNFLLQRLEVHRGLVVVTTNALERIDTAFLRRFDSLLTFRAPDIEERIALWQAHLPPSHAASQRCLAEVVEACVLSGGQIRNVALSATSAALAGSSLVDDSLLLEALRREYRRSGALCPVGRV